VSGGWTAFRVCAYLSTADRTAEEMVAQSLVYLTVLIHSFEMISVVQWRRHLLDVTFTSASGYPQVFWIKGTLVDPLLS